jgi:TM2 domain-containing membrane protein YozV
MQDESENRAPMPPRGPDTVPMRAAGGRELPPHPLDKEWWVHINGTAYGPYSGHEIRRMIEEERISATDHVCPAGSQTWVAAKDDPMIGTLFHKKPQGGSAGNVTANGGTIVQVTNNVPSVPLTALFADGPIGPKSPGIALLLSLLICGVGQMYNGQVAKGILMLIGCILLWFVFLGWIIWIWAMIDAYTTAKNMNQRYQQQLLAASRPA